MNLNAWISTSVRSFLLVLSHINFQDVFELSTLFPKQKAKQINILVIR